MSSSTSTCMYSSRNMCVGVLMQCMACRLTWVIMVPTVLPFFLDACEADSSACGALTHLCCSGEAYPKYGFATSVNCDMLANVACASFC